MNPTSIEVGDVLEKCAREVARFIGTIHGDVRVFKGDGATLYFDQFRTEIRWFSEQGEEIGDEKTTNDYPFNVVRVARDMEGKKMHLIFFSEHDDFADEFEFEEGDIEDADEGGEINSPDAQPSVGEETKPDFSA